MSVDRADGAGWSRSEAVVGGGDEGCVDVLRGVDDATVACFGGSRGNC